MDTPPFSELGLPEELLAAVESLGFERPSPIQALSIPVALSGVDLLGLSQTGSGKTAAFTLPVLARIDLKSRSPQALIVCPTRELAVQVCEEVHRLGAQMRGLRAVPVYGGAPMDRQLRALHDGAHIVVGTPGRLLDHVRRGSFDTSKVAHVVLDEADRMLDLGFREEMEEMLAALPEGRQTLFFSATMSPGVKRLIEHFGRDPQTVKVEQKAKTVSTIDQSCIEVRERSKVEVISRILDIEAPRLAIIFCNTKRAVDECTESLLARGYSVDRLHGDITQQMRERVLKRFRDGVVEVLVATDVAARGLDVENIDIVFNYDLPQDPEDYVHRIGRTGRAGRAGRSVSFVFGREIHRMEMIERYIRQQIRRERVPSQEQVEGKLADQLFEGVKDRLTEGKFNSYQDQMDRLLEQGFTPTDVASVLFTMLRESNGREFGEIAEDREELRERRRPAEGRREPREPREPREHAPRERDGDMVPLFLSLGKLHGVRPGEIVGMLYNEAGLPQGAVGHIKLFNKHSCIDVRAEFADRLIQVAKRTKLRGRSFVLDYDRGPGNRTQGH
ncbi:MAG TPA: DEAD/DEAH box helicase [Luteolibacter sp.]